jgi:carbamoyltransferase
MLLVAPVQKHRQLSVEGDVFQGANDDLFSVINYPRSDIPAVTHVDYSARIQTVSVEDKPDYHNIIKAFKDLTGYGVVVNTSFNVRGEPIVCTPQDAYTCFMRTEMDMLVLGDCLLRKRDQPVFEDAENWRESYELD